MRLALGSDHRGYQIKSKLITLLQADGYETIDFGTRGTRQLIILISLGKSPNEFQMVRSDRGILIVVPG